MSLFGSLWLSRVPYLAWLFPVLLGVSGVHLLLLLRNSPRRGYGPFLLSLAGIAVLLVGRGLFPLERWIPLIGMPLMVAGSLLNSFSADRFSLSISRSPRGRVSS